MTAKQQVPSIRRHLLWEYNWDDIDFSRLATVVIECVIERGNAEEWQEIVDFYGVDKILAVARKSTRLDKKHKKFTSLYLQSGFIHDPQRSGHYPSCHRLSIDLDFFSTHPFDNQVVEAHLVSNFGFFSDYVETNTLKGFIQNIKVDFLTHAFPLVRPLVKEEGVSLASLEDIGAMKLNAIAHSGNRQKDFYDLYFLLEHFSLQDLLNAYEEKYPNSNKMIPLKGITWFEDIDFELEKPMLKKKVAFKSVEKRLLAATQFPKKVF